MCFVFIVNNIFQLDSLLFKQLVKKLRVKLVCNSTDLLYVSFFLGSMIDKVSCYANGQCAYLKLKKNLE